MDLDASFSIAEWLKEAISAWLSVSSRRLVRADYETLQQHIVKMDNDNKDIKAPTWKNRADATVGRLEVVMFEFKAAQWQLTVMDIAGRQKRALDERYRCCTWVSYGAFLVATVLGVVGKLHGETVLSGD